jgi:hypothetical protein
MTTIILWHRYISVAVEAWQTETERSTVISHREAFSCQHINDVPGGQANQISYIT